MNLFELSEYLYSYLLNQGVKFSDEGYPIITEDMIIREMPDEVCPLGKTSAVKNKKRSMLVSFNNDEEIYKKLLSLDKDIDKYLEFKAFGGFDLSPRINWDLNLQKFNIALNMMADVYLALHGVKLIPNFRTGCLDTVDMLALYPTNSWFTVGVLGCSNGHIKINEMYLRTKLIITNPEMLIFYGKLKKEYSDILDEYGVQYKVFTDYQRISRGEKVK
ncbi:protein of unknown function [Acetitomaculum ruminis DSM 5522]|uniref:Uncharacterized protein n=1 Tax=Acetitomaculum ruminis DSM 5522 TaxID=1120918 RepID=A0A1I0WIQ0_9FIRM|nr:DUF4417 domain-containing protein [Acetitomaculum ruminis]SFA88491.1 protein of unknown function [Acetitomaculum ruminis DSM 5522]